MSVLEVLSSLSSGVVGALVVFWLTTHRDKQKAKEREKAERAALWRLVDMEIYQNIGKLEMIRDSPNIGQLYDSYAQLHIETWSENKSLLAQLLPPDRIEVLVKYYGLIERLGISLHDEPFKPHKPLTRSERRNSKVKRVLEEAQENASASKDTLLSVYARDALKYGTEARQFGRDYIGGVPDHYLLQEEEAAEKD